MQRVLIAVVPAIIVPVAQPIGLHTDGGVLALQVVLRTGHVARAAQGHRLVAGRVVLAVVHPVADLQFRNAAEVVAGVLAHRTARIVAAYLIRTVPAIILVVALPRLEDAAPVAATIFRGRAGVITAILKLLICRIPTIIIAIAGPQT
jgi:hypothetical protein